MTKEELWQIRTLSETIRREEARLLSLKDYVSRITTTLDGLPHATGYQESSVESLTVQIVDCEKQIAELKKEKASRQASLLLAIDAAVTDIDSKSVLAERYVFEQDYNTIQRKLHFSLSKIYALHRQGVKAVADSTIKC